MRLIKILRLAAIFGIRWPSLDGYRIAGAQSIRKLSKSLVAIS